MGEDTEPSDDLPLPLRRRESMSSARGIAAVLLQNIRKDKRRPMQYSKYASGFGWPYVIIMYGQHHLIRKA